MTRSNAPLALSVVSMTEPGDLDQTLFNITEFDDRDFGFSHDRTWNTMAVALRGIFSPDAVGASLPNVPIRVKRCIVGLCELGKRLKLNTRSFMDYPAAGLRPVTPTAWDPAITVRVKGSCWFVENSRPMIPLLQPRKSAISGERLSVYLRLGRQAFCQGDWTDAGIKLIDLAGDGDIVHAEMYDEMDIGLASDALLAEYVKTYVEAKRVADAARAERPKRRPAHRHMEDLFEV